MIWQSPLAADVDRRDRNRSIRKCTVRLVLFVAAGAALATWTLPPAATPANVAKEYLDARFAHDWEKAWSPVCSGTRTAWVDYPTYAENAAGLDPSLFFVPSDVDVSVGRVRGVPGPNGPSATVPIILTVDERNGEDWHLRREVHLVEEDGEFRVCHTQL